MPPDPATLRPLPSTPALSEVFETLAFFRDPNFARSRFERYGDVYETSLLGQRTAQLPAAGQASRQSLICVAASREPCSTTCAIGSVWGACRAGCMSRASARCGTSASMPQPMARPACSISWLHQRPSHPAAHRARRPLAPAGGYAAGDQLHVRAAGPEKSTGGPAAAASGWGLRPLPPRQPGGLLQASPGWSFLSSAPTGIGPVAAPLSAPIPRRCCFIHSPRPASPDGCACGPGCTERGARGGSTSGDRLGLRALSQQIDPADRCHQGH